MKTESGDTKCQILNSDGMLNNEKNIFFDLYVISNNEEFLEFFQKNPYFYKSMMSLFQQPVSKDDIVKIIYQLCLAIESLEKTNLELAQRSIRPIIIDKKFGGII